MDKEKTEHDAHPHIHHVEEEYDEFRDSHWRTLATVSGVLIIVALVIVALIYS